VVAETLQNKANSRFSTEVANVEAIFSNEMSIESNTNMNISDTTVRLDLP